MSFVSGEVEREHPAAGSSRDDSPCNVMTPTPSVPPCPFSLPSGLAPATPPPPLPLLSLTRFPPLARHSTTSCIPPADYSDTPLFLLRPTPSVAVGDYVESTLDQSRTIQQQKPIACHANPDQSRALVDPAILPGLSGRKEGWRVCFAIVPSCASKPAICKAQARKEQEVSVVG